MTQAKKIDSNITGLRYAEEASLGVLPGSPVWRGQEPNSYKDFGGNISTVARNPINSGRQRKKGVITDLDSAGGYESDFTETNLSVLMQGFLFANYRTKTELVVATTDGTANDYEPASGGAAYAAGDLLLAKFFSNSVNNGLKLVTGTPGATSVPVTDTGITTETGASGIVSKVGVQFGTTDAVIDGSGVMPALTTTTKDLTDLGLIPGEWVFLGGDTSGTNFANAANVGFARVRSIAAHRMTFDKTEAAFVTDAGTGKTVRMFFGRVLKNEIGTDIIRRSYQLERTLGVPDDASPTDQQAEYIIGAVPNELMVNITQASKIVDDLCFVAIDHEFRTADDGLKSGSRPDLQESEAFNTSSDIPRMNMAMVDDTNSAITPLFSFVTDLKLTVKNNNKTNKAVGYLGGFDVTSGMFDVDGSVTAYLSSVEAVAAVRSNANVTLDVHLVKNNAGVTIDLPLVSLGDGRANVVQDTAIMLPLTMPAATGASIDANLNHTMMFVFWDYLPNAAA